jgi:glycosyltransferase involved in cell wall biosynthesis
VQIPAPSPGTEFSAQHEPRGDGPAGGRKRIVITRRAALDYRDGINIFIFALADAFDREGHDVAILATTVGDPARIQRLFAMRTQPTMVAVEARSTRFSFEGLTAGWLRRGRQLINQHDADLVINNGALPFSVQGHSCNLAHDLGWSTHRRLEALRGAYKRYAYARCDDVVALSREVRDGLARQLRMARDAIHLIPPCVDVEATQSAASATREDAILHTGTEGYKDPAATIRAFAALDRDATRLYVEGPVDEPLRSQVAALPPATRSRIELVGALPAAQLRALLGSVRVASFPTRYAVPTASSTVVEAIAAGTPIAGSMALSADVLDHGRNGLACRDDAELAAALGQLLSDGAWDAMSRGALDMAQHFSATVVARRYLSMIEPRIA